MRKIVINTCYGGFGLSDQAQDLYMRLTQLDEIHTYDIKRDDPALVEVVEALGERANDTYAMLKVVAIPEDVKWYIHEYDGVEQVYEQHRKWE